MQLQEMKGQLRSRDQRTLELQVETEQLQEQAARQNAVIASLKKRIQVYCYHICNVTYICYIKISVNLGFIGPCIFTHSNESTNQMQQLITGLLLVV
jgi:hypothetical protein